jgi:carboxyl-terminal processing protease
MTSQSNESWAKSFFGAGALPIGWSLGLLTGVLLAQVFLGPLRESLTGPDLDRYRQVRNFAREVHVREVSNDDLLDAALTGMLSSLDEYSRYYGESGSVSLERETSGRFQSIGLVFRRLEDNWRAIFPTANSPALRGGVRVGDTILAIDGESTVGVDGEHFTSMLSAGDRESMVISVEHRDGTHEDLTVHPTVLIDPSVRHVRMLDRNAGIGYVSIESFSRETSDEFDRAVSVLRKRGAKSLIVDLRGNLGGVLDSAIEIAQRFVPEGVILSTEGRGQPHVDMADSSLATMEDLDLVILVDGHSASASEVLAGCLQDHRCAVLVGSRTYGKGVVQSIRRFQDPPASAKVTSAYYYSPARRNFERTAHPDREPGLVPDVLVDLDQEQTMSAHVFLFAYAPPAAAMADIEAWEQEEDRQVLEPLPDDAQMRTALAMLGGDFPG